MTVSPAACAALLIPVIPSANIAPLAEVLLNASTSFCASLTKKSTKNFAAALAASPSPLIKLPAMPAAIPTARILGLVLFVRTPPIAPSPLPAACAPVLATSIPALSTPPARLKASVPPCRPLAKLPAALAMIPTLPPRVFPNVVRYSVVALILRF